ncbi:MAG: hypothetical protein ACHQVS_04220 [Candidatus Babeliales bacterium]
MTHSLFQNITAITIILVHSISYTMELPAPTPDDKIPEANTDEYRREKTTKLEQALLKAVAEKKATTIKEFVEKHTVKGFWGMPLREAVLLAKNGDRTATDLVRYLIKERADISHGTWGERIAHPLYKSGYTEEPTLALAGDNQELINILLGKG